MERFDLSELSFEEKWCARAVVTVGERRTEIRLVRGWGHWYVRGLPKDLADLHDALVLEALPELQAVSGGLPW